MGGQGKSEDTTFNLQREADQHATRTPNDKSEVPTSTEDKHDSQEKQDIENQGSTIGPKPARFAIPVMLDDGREFLMEWEAGADLQQIATAWALQHDIPEEMVPQLVDVAQQLS